MPAEQSQRTTYINSVRPLEKLIKEGRGLTTTLITMISQSLEQKWIAGTVPLFVGDSPVHHFLSLSTI